MENKRNTEDKENNIDKAGRNSCFFNDFMYEVTNIRDRNPAKSSDLTNQEQNNGNQPEKNAKRDCE